MINGLERMDNAAPFSPAAYKLAGKIIALCNSLHWQCDVRVSVNRLASMIGSSENTALKARKELVERGVIVQVGKGCKGNPSLYRLNDMSKFYAENAQNSQKYSAGCSANFALIKKQNIYDNEISEEEVQRYRESITAIENAAKGIGLPFAAADCMMADQLMAEYSAEWVLAAIKRAQDRKRTWGMVKGILQSWKKKGGIDDARNQQHDGRIGTSVQDIRKECRYDMSGSYL